MERDLEELLRNVLGGVGVVVRDMPEDAAPHVRVLAQNAVADLRIALEAVEEAAKGREGEADPEVEGAR